MQPDDATKIAETLLSPGPLGAFTLLITGIVALHKGYIRLGREVMKLEAEVLLERARADKWQEVAMSQLQQTDRAIAVAKTATSIVSGGPQ
jgi:hypothetical protein